MATPSWFREKRASQSGVTLLELLFAMLIATVITTMLIVGWINLQQTSVFALASNSARGDARDSISRISSELRDCQPTTFPTASPSPTSTPALFATAHSTDAKFYSAYNDRNAAGDESGTVVRLTRIWLGTANPNDESPLPTSSLRKWLYWRRDTNGNGLDASDPTKILAKFTVNNDPDIQKPVFRYGHLTAAGVVWSDNVTGADLAAITAVQVRIIIDANRRRPPVPVDLTTTVRLRNTTTY
jgi:type II secretory pathway pseudopilin PulG